MVRIRLAGLIVGITTWLGIVPPTVSLTIGGWVTYIIDVRTRRRTYVEDLFDQAISAVALAVTAVGCMAGAVGPQRLSDDEYEPSALGCDRGSTELGPPSTANEAIAQPLPSGPDVVRVLPFTTGAGNRAGPEMIERISQRRDRAPPRREGAPLL